MHETETISLPTGSPGTHRQLTVHRWGSSGARPKVYIQAGLHADELPGVLAACHLIPLLDQAARDCQIVGEVILVPTANPIGMAQSLHGRHHGRFAFADGFGNFNRGWPDLGGMILGGDSDKLGNDPGRNIKIVRAALLKAVAALPDLSEVEALRKALLSLSIDADFVFDLHCDAQALLHLFANHEHEDLIVELGQDMGARVILLETSVDAGLFDECNGGPWIKLRRALGLSPAALPAACFAPTVGLRGQSDVSAELGAQDAAGIIRFLRRRGMIRGPVATLPDALCQPSPIAACDMVYAPCAGMVIWHKPVGSSVACDDHLADIVDLSAPDPLFACTPVHAAQTGVLFSHRTGYLTRPGEILGQIAGTAPLSRRHGVEFLNP